MPTVVQVEEQILACEGFRVRLVLLKPTTKTIPAYDFLVMAPQRWRVSDWKTVRLRAYVTAVRSVSVLRGDGSVAPGDPQLGGVRDSYYLAKHGSLAAAPVDGTLSIVADVPDRPKLAARRARRDNERDGT